MSKNKLTVLRIDSSGRRHGSTTRALTDQFIESLKEKTADVAVITRDLADGMPFVDEDWIGANFTPAENRTAAQSAILAFSDSLVEELKAADIVVIGAPIYNFNILAVLKAWIDQVARARVTFQYTEKGPVGLLKGKRAVIVTASGGVKVGSDYDFGTDYLKHLLAFIGITETSMIAADGLATDQDGALSRAGADLKHALLTVETPFSSAA